MIELEGIAHKITSFLYDDSGLDDIKKAKIEYGLSLTLGVALAMAIALILAVIFKTIPQTLALTLSALVLRIFSGGAHCSSYDRCLIFSLLVFVPVSVIVKFLTGALAADVLMGAYIGILSIMSIYLLFKSYKLSLLVLLTNGIVAGIIYALYKEFLSAPLFAIGTGMLIQSSMLTKIGQWFVRRVDLLLKSVVK